MTVAMASVSWEERISEGDLTVKNVRATPEQAHNMSLITLYARQFCGTKWGERAAYIGIAVSVHETTCKNLPYGDRDSVGLFQQRPSQGWGTAAQILDREYACKKFYAGLLPALKRGESDLQAAETAQWSTLVPPVYWDEAQRAAAYFWGNQTGGGSSGGGRPDTNSDGSRGGSGRIIPYEFSRGDADNKHENSWDCAGRLAEEVRWHRFMRSGVLWFVSENWLMKQRPSFVLREFSPGVRSIDFNWDTRRGTTPMSSFRAKAAECSIQFDAKRYGIQPGDVVELVGVGTGSGKWLTSEVNRTLTSPTAEVTLKRWQEKLPEPRAERKDPPERNPNVNGHPTPTTSTGEWIWPVDPHPITSNFGPRNSPGGIGSTNHDGIDIGVGDGTVVRAVADGKVTVASYNGGYGNYVEIDHGNGLVSFYGHLKSFNVGAGRRVSQGHEIARSNNTGSSTGAHLHFGTHKNGAAVDPMGYLP